MRQQTSCMSSPVNSKSAHQPSSIINNLSVLTTLCIHVQQARATLFKPLQKLLSYESVQKQKPMSHSLMMSTNLFYVSLLDKYTWSQFWFRGCLIISIWNEDSGIYFSDGNDEDTCRAVNKLQALLRECTTELKHPNILQSPDSSTDKPSR